MLSFKNKKIKQVIPQNTLRGVLVYFPASASVP